MYGVCLLVPLSHNLRQHLLNFLQLYISYLLPSEKPVMYTRISKMIKVNLVVDLECRGVCLKLDHIISQ